MGKTNRINILSFNELGRIYTIILVIIALALSSFGSYLYYIHTKRHGHAYYEKWLLNTLNDRNSGLQELVDKYIKQAKRLSYESTIINAFPKLEKSASSKELSQELNEFLDENSSAESYDNTILIDKNGKILFSDFATEYIGFDLMKSPGLESALGESFQRIVMGLTEDISLFAYDSVLKRPALYVGVPIFDQQKMLLGVIVSEVTTQRIYNIMEQYVGLGNTGDIIFGEQSESGILLVSQSRNAHTKPFKNFVSYQKLIATTIDFPLARGCEGSVGTGIADNFMGKETIAAWSYIPRFDWGATAQEFTSEFDRQFKTIHIIPYFLLLLTLLAAAYLIYINENLRQLLYQRSFSMLKIISLAMAILLLIKAYFVYYNINAGLNQVKEQTRERINLAQQEINRHIANGESVGTALVHDLNEGKIKKEDIIARIKRDVFEYPLIFGITVAFEPYTYSKDKRLYAPYVHETSAGTATAFGDLVFEHAEKSYDYLAEKEKVANVLDPSSWAWYSAAMETKRTMWFDPYIDAQTGILLTGYSMVFYEKDGQSNKKPMGVVNVLIDCSRIRQVAQNLDIGKQGYTTLISATGKFIYHPRNNYVAKRFTMKDVAEEEGSEKLLIISQEILKGNYGFHSYTKYDTNEKMWIYSEGIPATKWVLNGLFSDNEGALTRQVLRQYWMELLSIILLLLAALLILTRYLFNWSFAIYSSISTVILLSFIVMTLTLVWITPNFDQFQGFKITDPVRLSGFLAAQDIYAEKINEPINAKIPTGLDITAINFPTSTAMSLAGYVWQIYNKDIAHLISEVSFETIQLAEFRKLYQRKQGDDTVVGWEFNAKLDQKFHYNQYPFDSVVLNINMDYPDFDEPAILVPSLADYRNIAPASIPGLETYSSLTGFSIYESFFSFEWEDLDQSYGLQSLANIPGDYVLTFKIMMRRLLLYDFVVFFLPTIIVFFLLYAIFIIEDREKLSGLYTLSAYTGLAFAVTLLHRSIRERIITSEILYMEYLFFMIYVTFAILVVYTILRVMTGEAAPLIKRIFGLFREFFWPMQLLALYIITFAVFYY